ncbi:hypothetical protein ACIBO2_02590 [Nonomuraea sp. NPDC050022]|uniref:hypothetical protein n=1 Tax=unclassified Nonomuraea TaxID=2593643 RepID=UPI0033F64678
MLIRTTNDRLVPVDGAGWRASSGLLELRLAAPVSADPAIPAPAVPADTIPGGAAVARVLLAVDLDCRSHVLDVDLIGLPAELLAPLSRYAVPPRPSTGSGPVALDLDAAWLWIHVQDGHRVSRQRRSADVRFSFAGAGLVAIQARLTEAANEPD